ncbi:prolyl oligopeptidase family serine peptidase [Mitsuaria sp. GD03876]|uniref:alpha/beta hydrolase family protein n=1 Tax=Mitsuaria sp. GD03876 TaxID=2975399 RepID=UPI00244AADBC|nr:prolyl oligopeptidase family serine peptidase [Mitsuaria sp. GD03876]MDH0862948.1 prolyl oligopeptidase family serine peptidase [Mitsuaria sp. GD03876]
MSMSRASSPSPRSSRLSRRARQPLIVALAAALGGAAATAAPADEAAATRPLTSAATLAQVYQQPSAAIRAVLDTQGLPTFQVSPDQRTLAIAGHRRFRTIAELARPVLRQAGLRYDPATDSPQLMSEIDALTLRALPGGDAERRVVLPAGGTFHLLRFSPDGKRFLLNRRTATAVELWVGDVATGKLKAVPKLKLHTMLENDVVWLNDHELMTLTVPAKRGPAPVFSAPAGPAIQESIGRNSPERTTQDLLANAQDAAVFAHHASSQLARVDLTTGVVKAVGEPGLFTHLEALGTPGQVLTMRLLEPFSYQLAWDDFASQAEVRGVDGKVVAIGRTKLKEGVPVEGVITGPRHFFASPGGDGAVYWVEALDDGDNRVQVPHRDRLMRLDAPYTGEAREVHRVAQRLSRLEFLEGGKQALVQDFDLAKMRTSTELVTMDGAAPAQRLVERSVRDRYRDPGTPVGRMQPTGRTVARVDDGAIWYFGLGASPEGDKPFIDRLTLADNKKSRVFQSGVAAQGGDAAHFERPLAVLDGAGAQVLTVRESIDEPGNVMLRGGASLADIKPLTEVKNPTPQLRDIQREFVRFKRADGVELSFWLYKPPGYQAGERRPTFVWAYPLEYTDASTAGQVSGSTNRFNTFPATSPLMLLLDGYVVLMDATMPVVGDPKTVNDSFIAQITANAQAIIDKAVELGVSDRDHMVVGGHSYGAFMTANLLAHTHLFKAGIARSGAYNRSLTPFGFQSERRTYWEAQDVYQRLSPFNYADKLKEPLLLIHGEADNNPGTFPIQSARLYQALAGTGGTVRYVTLPHESHGYTARESIGHTLWEMSEWMKRQVGPGAPIAPSAGAEPQR